ncbi:MAG: T9SS type A sorting domain-containing protein [Ignavibacteria bacterium]|nr:T9SS type A sorting domain-containing protein [Ignavibacteria bacterium]
MKTTVLLLIALCFSVMPVGATTIDGRFLALTNNGSAYSVKVQIKVDASKDMGGATMQFSFNTSSLSFPNSPSSGTHYTFQNFSGGSYGTATVTKTIANGNTLSLNIELLTDNAGTTVGTGWTDVATINFTTANAAGNSNLQWTLVEVYDEDNATLWSNGLWDNLNSSPLPVELVAFSGRHAGGVTALRWTTASELNNTGFVVERATDGRRWDSISFVPGHFSSDLRHDYEYQDIVPAELIPLPMLWYRLRQVDRDGRVEYSQIVRVSLPSATAVAVLHAPYPNPFARVTVLSFTLMEAQPVTLHVIDGAGRTVHRLHDDALLSAGSHSMRFDGSGLPAGVYHVVLRTSRGSETRTLLLAR